MTITIVMKTGNDAFQDDSDVANALRELAKRIDARGLSGVSKVIDVNGCTIGTVTTSDD